ncbi:hypothetical protein, partial [Pseudomonas aeruginosa]|uniref:hypothetical protein n=1 Tax=Pseudomonas aeruginosa TaxID=287 RepID=UPI0039C137EC
IQNKVLRLEHEVVKPTAEQFIRINQQHIRENTKIAGPPVPGEEDRDWSWHNIGPEALAGEFELEIVGGSMAPENPVQNRDDAQA